MNEYWQLSGSRQEAEIAELSGRFNETFAEYVHEPEAQDYMVSLVPRAHVSSDGNLMYPMITARVARHMEQRLTDQLGIRDEIRLTDNRGDRIHATFNRDGRQFFYTVQALIGDAPLPFEVVISTKCPPEYMHRDLLQVQTVEQDQTTKAGRMLRAIGSGIFKLAKIKGTLGGTNHWM